MASRGEKEGLRAALQQPGAQYALLGVVAVLAIVGLILLFLGETASTGQSAYYSRPFAARPEGWIGPYTPGSENLQKTCIDECGAYYYGSQEYAVCWAGCLREQEDLSRRVGGVRPYQIVPPS